LLAAPAAPLPPPLPAPPPPEPPALVRPPLPLLPPVAVDPLVPGAPPKPGTPPEGVTPPEPATSPEPATPPARPPTPPPPVEPAVAVPAPPPWPPPDGEPAQPARATAARQAPMAANHPEDGRGLHMMCFSMPSSARPDQARATAFAPFTSAHWLSRTRLSTRTVAQSERHSSFSVDMACWRYPDDRHLRVSAPHRMARLSPPRRAASRCRCCWHDLGGGSVDLRSHRQR